VRERVEQHRNVTCLRVTSQGKELVLEGEPEDLLIDVLRRHGRKSVLSGCRDKSCGACRILLDGSLVTSCDRRFDSLREGASIETYEDVQASPEVARVLTLFNADRNTRCQLCVAGLGVAAEYIERKGYGAGVLDEALRGSTCKCTGRGSLRRALTRDEP
jgi:aerobic carbon-monoxide dehydrogenase small subunit